jgi:rhamnogalacturonan acetylesterase
MKLGNATMAAAAACPPICVSAYPKLLLTGSTPVASSFMDIFTGWGAHIPPYLNLSVMNQATPLSSVRQLYNSPAWSRTLSLAAPGDFVVLEFGIDDDGDPLAAVPKNGTRNLRPALPGTGDETVNLTYDILTLTKNGNATVKTTNTTRTEVIHTFGWYLKNLIIDIRDKSAVPIISSHTPRNWYNVSTTSSTSTTLTPGTNGSNTTKPVLPTEYKFRDYAQQVSEELKVDFIDHTYYTLRYLSDLGPTESSKLFGVVKMSARNATTVVRSNVFTNKAGAKAFAETFVQAVRCARSELGEYLSEDGAGVEEIVC